MQPKVSINCITYNHEKFIAETIESFLSQKTDFDFEILIGEDCSTDGTRGIIKKYADQYPDIIKLVYSNENVGMMKNVERLHNASRGKYIAACEGDDFWNDPYKLQKQVDYMESHPECSLYAHAVNLIDYTNRGKVRIERTADKDSIFTIEDILKNRGSFISTPSMLLRRDIVKKLPEFFTKCPVGDLPMAMILAHKGYVYYKNDPMATYRYGYQNSWSSQNAVGKNLRGKLINQNKTDIYILENFNEYSNFEYDSLIKSIIAIRKADITLLKKDFSILKTHFNNQTAVKKLKLRIFALIPDLYTKLLDLKAGFKSKI